MLPLKTLRGTVVALEPLDPRHLDGLTAIGLEPSLWTWTSEGYDSPEAMRTWMERSLAARDSGSVAPFAVRHLASGSLAGSTRYMNYEPGHSRVEIGFTWYGIAFQRTAINTECKYLLLAYAFEEMQLNRVELKTDLRNERSQRAIERIGAVREGVLRRHMITSSGRVRDTVYYSILREEWPDVKRRLEERMAAY
jgi:RimJ/RimL family protein N-acetyltransferase